MTARAGRDNSEPAFGAASGFENRVHERNRPKRHGETKESAIPGGQQNFGIREKSKSLPELPG
jgi:hypothetical protein